MVKVLVVEDEMSQAEVLKVLLGAAGFEVLLASNGVDALAMLEVEKPSLIITDHMMPLMSGGELAIHVRTNPAHQSIPILMTSATEECQIRPRSRHYDAFLRKPYGWSDLIKKVSTLTLSPTR